MTAIQLQSLVDQAIQQIKDLIITGRVLPGHRLKEEELALMFQISRPPIREAFKALESEGLVIRKPRRGVFVAEITEDDIWEIYTLKAALYEFSMKLALRKADARWIENLEHAQDKMRRCVESDSFQLSEYQSLHAEFHRLAFDLAGHKRITRIIESLEDHVKRIISIRLAEFSSVLISLDYHHRIVEAVKKGDHDAAVSLTKEHVIDALRQLESALESNPDKYAHLISRNNTEGRENEAADSNRQRKSFQFPIDVAPWAGDDSPS